MKLKSIYIKGFKHPDREINLTFSEETVTVIYGMNGSGKTTLLKVLHAIFTKDENVLRREKVEEINSQNYLIDKLSVKKEILEEFAISKNLSLADIKLICKGKWWQEQELSLHFIGPMFSVVRFTEIYKFNLFAQRPLNVTYQDWQIMGKPDGLIASFYID